jgi:proteasome lid subunit RPN8/RPN11
MQHTQPGAPQEVLFSRRAIAAICAETLEHHPLETGGILLGHWHQQRWQVLEAIDPGPDARCTATTFEYDCAYVDHLASKLARQYRQPLQLIGLWHRHPGSFDRFSAEDDVTNQRFAALTPHGALSCLVNLDPDFRLTAFHVPKDLRYVRLPLVVGDALIDSQLREPLHPRDLEPEELAEQALAAELQQMLARVPRVRSALLPALADGLEPLLAALEAQNSWRYGLRACGRVLQVALVEVRGSRRQLWELSLSRSGQLQALREDGWQLSGSAFTGQLQEVARVY